MPACSGDDPRRNGQQPWHHNGNGGFHGRFQLKRAAELLCERHRRQSGSALQVNSRETDRHFSDGVVHNSAAPADAVGVHPFGEQRSSHGYDAGPPPRLLVVLHEFADDERREYPGGAYPVTRCTKRPMRALERHTCRVVVRRDMVLGLCGRGSIARRGYGVCRPASSLRCFPLFG
jgi:hypothetical protein